METIILDSRQRVYLSCSTGGNLNAGRDDKTIQTVDNIFKANEKNFLPYRASNSAIVKE
jgi:hypothetical protein